MTPGLYSLQLSNTHKEHPHRIHSSLSQEGIHAQLALTFFSLKPRKRADSQEYKVRASRKKVFNLRIKGTSQERLFHKEHTLIIQLIV